MVRADLPEVRAVGLVHVALAVLEPDDPGVEEGLVPLRTEGNHLDVDCHHRVVVVLGQVGRLYPNAELVVLVLGVVLAIVARVELGRGLLAGVHQVDVYAVAPPPVELLEPDLREVYLGRVLARGVERCVE